MAKPREKKGRTQSKRQKALAGLVPLSVEEIQALTNKLKAKASNVDEPKLPMIIDKRRVAICEEAKMDWPELWLNVYVHGPEAGPNFYKMFARAKCFKADTPDDADLVVFSGSGHDVNPELYGESRHIDTFVDDSIDKSNLSLIAFCLKRGIPMVGVCGGAQILHVALGGKLFQHVDGHNGAHTMWCNNDRMLIQKVSSVHHQMCIRNDKLEVLATAHVSRKRYLNNKECDNGSHGDVEAFFYRDQCVLGFQGHPEYSGYPKYTEWCLKQVDHYLNENPDLCYRHNDNGSNKLRIKQEIMDELAAKKPKVVEIPSEDIIIVENTKG